MANGDDDVGVAAVVEDPRSDEGRVETVRLAQASDERFVRRGWCGERNSNLSSSSLDVPLSHTPVTQKPASAHKSERGARRSSPTF